jgi:hypothetical protein
MVGRFRVVARLPFASLAGRPRVAALARRPPVVPERLPEPGPRQRALVLSMLTRARENRPIVGPYTAYGSLPAIGSLADGEQSAERRSG